MEPTEILRRLEELAAGAGIEVRTLARALEGEPPASAVCRVRGAVWVVLAPGDTLDRRIDVLGRALHDHAAAALADSYLPPAVRARIRGDSDST